MTHETAFKQLCQLCSQNTVVIEIDPSALAWPLIWKAALRHRVAPVLTDRLKQLGIAPPDDIAEQMLAHNRKNLLKGMKQSAELVFLTELFEQHEIPFMAFKGLAFNHLVGLELSQRHTGDIDLLLAQTEDLWRTDQLLQAQGYQRKTPPASLILNTPQKKNFLKYAKDMTYWHPEKHINLELHFKLNNNNLLFPVAPAELYANKTSINIGNTPIPVMSKLDHQLYLLVHGAVSRWFRLKWLCDIPLISHNGRDYNTALLERATNLGVERMVIQGLWLAHEQLRMPIPDSIQVQHDNNPAVQKLIEFAKQHQLGVEPAQWHFGSLLPNLGFKLSTIFWYQWLLRAGAHYKTNQVGAYLTNAVDWDTVSLPAVLFGLYYPLRPFLWLKRQLQ